MSLLRWMVHLSASVVVVSSAFPVEGAAAQETVTPEAFCAEFPEPHRNDCLAAGELLTAPRDPAPEPNLTLKLTAGNGELLAEYRRPEDGMSAERTVECPVAKTIDLPAERDMRLLFTSRDAIYSFAAPGLVEPVDLVPGRINERLIRTPAASGPVASELRADRDGRARPVALRFVAGDDPPDLDALCAGETRP